MEEEKMTRSAHRQKKLQEENDIRLKHYKETGKLLPSTPSNKKKPKFTKIEYKKGFFLVDGHVKKETKKQQKERNIEKNIK